MRPTAISPVSPRPVGDDDFAYWVTQEANPLLADLRTFANTRQQSRLTTQTSLSAIPKVIWISEDMPVLSAWEVSLSVLAISTETPAASRAAYKRVCRFSRNLAGSVILGAIATPVADFEDVAAWDVTPSATGNGVQLTVTGDATRTVNWAAVVIVTEAKI